MKERKKKIYLVAGEASGDQFGALLMKALKEESNSLEFYGIGGEKMEAQGLKSLFPMSELSLMGLFEILPHLPNLINRLRQTVDHVLRIQPDVVVTIDSPGFTYRLAKRLKKDRIPLIHAVAPSVWAWRPGRAKKIARFFDRLLTLFPFEPPYFEKEGLPTTFIGHPIVEIGFDEISKEAAKESFKVPSDEILLLLLPGSRRGEIRKLLPLMSEASQRLQKVNKKIRFKLAAVPHQLEEIQSLLGQGDLEVEIVTDSFMKKRLMRAADLAIAASGTVSLELALCETPHIVVYKINPLTAWIVKQLIRVEHVSLVNLLLKRACVPELLQEACTAEKIFQTVLNLLNDKERDVQRSSLAKIKGMLAPEGSIPSQVAAEAVTGFLRGEVCSRPWSNEYE